MHFSLAKIQPDPPQTPPWIGRGRFPATFFDRGLAALRPCVFVWVGDVDTQGYKQQPTTSHHVRGV